MRSLNYCTLTGKHYRSIVYDQALISLAVFFTP